jgi:hypothetical protein
MRAVLKRTANTLVTLMPKKPPRDWTWKRLTEPAGKKRPLNYRKPDFMLNAHGQTVRFHAPHPIVPAIERFMAFVRSVACADDAEDDCWQWIGGDTFRIDELTVTTPQRFIYQEATGEKLKANESLFQLCQTPGCVRPSHREKKRVK